MPVLPPFRSAGDSHPSSALVTGARRGIGKAIALALARRGLDVAVLDRVVTGELRAVAGDIRSLGRRSVAISADIARIEGHPAAIDEAEAAVGPLDYLVNVAGVSVQARGDLLDVTPESYDHCLDINTRGTFFLMQAFARRAVARPAATGRAVPLLRSRPRTRSPLPLPAVSTVSPKPLCPWPARYSRCA